MSSKIFKTGSHDLFTDRVEFTAVHMIRDPNFKQTEAICLAAVKLDGMALRYCNDKTKDICFAAIRENPEALMFIKCPSYEMMLEVVSSRGLLLSEIDTVYRTYAMCEAAVNQNGEALQYCPVQTLDLCKAAYDEDSDNFMYCDCQTEKMCIDALEYSIDNFEYIKDKTLRIWQTALEINGLLLENCPYNRIDVCRIAVTQTGHAIRWVPFEFEEELNMIAVEQTPEAIQYMTNPSNEVCLSALSQWGLTLQYIKNQTEELCIEAVTQNGLALQFCKTQTPEIIRIAMLDEDEDESVFNMIHYTVLNDYVNSGPKPLTGSELKNHIDFILSSANILEEKISAIKMLMKLRAHNSI